MRAVPTAVPLDDASIAETIAHSAVLARGIADVVCTTPVGHDTCGALHGVWLDLRRLGLAADPDRHAAFFAEAVDDRIAHADAQRVLVAGCADWGMLATVARAYAQRARALDVSVVDRCPTPAMLCAWYASRIALPVRTIVADLVQFAPEGAFDLVCTHSLLTYADLAGRQQLVANWHRMLSPGGAVVTVSRLDLESVQAPGAMSERARGFGDLVLERCGELGIDAGEGDLRARAERFAVAQISHRIGNDHDLRTLFETQGFDVVRLDVRRLEGMTGRRADVTGAARRNAYGELVAVRR